MKKANKREGEGIERWLLLGFVILVAPVAYDCFGQSESAYRYRQTGFDWHEYFTLRLPVSALIFGTLAFVYWFTRKRDDR